MRFGSICLAASLFVASVAPASASNSKPKVRRGPTSTQAKATTAKTKLASVNIDSERASRIQTALIGAGYMSGQPSGSWDAASIAAMGKFQSDNGWQTKLVPDSRAIIKLGLGSSYAPATYVATAPATTAGEPEVPATAVEPGTVTAANK